MEGCLGELPEARRGYTPMTPPYPESRTSQTALIKGGPPSPSPIWAPSASSLQPAKGDGRSLRRSHNEVGESLTAMSLLAISSMDLSKGHPLI